MIEIRRILCPIDFSDYSRRALDHAVAIARWYDSAITVLHVFSAAPVAAYAPGAPGFQSIVLSQADRDQLLAGMQRFIEEEAAPGVPIEPVLREGNAAREIVNQAAEGRADLVVLGTHGRSGFERLLLGSVTEKVLRQANCPVLTVPGRAPAAVPATPVLFKHILCPVDFSASSLRALNYAMSLAQEADAELIVLHVLAPDFDEFVDVSDAALPMGRLSVDELRQQREEIAERRLQSVVPDTVAAYCSVKKVMARGKPGREILRVAGDNRVELIVMGVQGRGAADLMLFGSTTQHVLRSAACPVLTLRQEERGKRKEEE